MEAVIDDEARARAIASHERRFLRMFRTHHAVLLMVEPTRAVILDANEAAAAYYGYPVERMRGMPLADLDMRPAAQLPDLLGRVVRREENIFLATHRLADGRERVVEVQASALEEEGGAIAFAFVRDVTDDLAAREALADSERRFRDLVESMSDVVVTFDLSGRCTWVSPSVVRMLGVQPGDLIGTSLLAERVHPDDQALVWRVPASAAAGSQSVPAFRCRLRQVDGGYRWVEAAASFHFREDGSLLETYAVVRDVDDQVRAEEELAASEEQFRYAMANAPIPMMLVGIDGALMRVNDAVTDMLGYGQDELGYLRFDDLAHPEDGGLAALPVAALVAGDLAAVAAERRFRTRDGEERWGQLSMTLVRNDDGTPAHYIVQFLDVTDIRAAREALAHQALHDPLTGLANRALFHQSLHKAHERARRRGRPYAVLFCDLDRFKQINDTHGHEVGDAVLQEVARRLLDSVRGSDTVARLGGDEFVVIAEDLAAPQDAALLAERIRASVTRPVACAGGLAVSPGTSIGVALSHGDGDALEVVRDADHAVYEAKGAGRDRWVLHGSGHPAVSAQD